MNGLLTMSKKEIDRLMIVTQIEGNKITVLEAADLLGLSQRQIYRILKRIKAEGTKGIIHKLRGKKSNRGYSKELKEKMIAIYRKQYSDYGPTLYSEMLIKYHNISLSTETVRNWLRENAVSTSIRKKRPHRRKRERRSCYGELLQFDGSYHDWFEGRGAECCLLNCVDDATGRVYLKFALSENTEDTMRAMWDYVKKNGSPRSIYTDKYSTYYAEGKLTDFARAMKELNIQMIYAKSPQAKGRVERFNRTLQDRLIKALRQEGISNIAEANKYLQEVFIDQFNQRFRVNLESADVHRGVEGYQLENIFCYKTTRQVRNDYTINLSGGYIQLLIGNNPLPRPKQDVTVSMWLNGEMHIYFNGQELNFTVLKSKPAKKGYKLHKVPKDHPWRKMNQKISDDKQRNFFRAAFG
jgi:hypothetical protein